MMDFFYINIQADRFSDALEAILKHWQEYIIF